MSYRRDPHAPLLRALSASAARFGLFVEPLALTARPWASATFTGERVTVTLRATGGDAAAWHEALPEEDLPVRGYVVADLVVRPGADTVIEILLLEA